MSPWLSNAYWVNPSLAPYPLDDLNASAAQAAASFTKGRSAREASPCPMYVYPGQTVVRRTKADASGTASRRRESLAIMPHVRESSRVSNEIKRSRRRFCRFPSSQRMISSVRERSKLRGEAGRRSVSKESGRTENRSPFKPCNGRRNNCQLQAYGHYGGLGRAVSYQRRR